MSPFQRKLAALSRDRPFLIRGVLIILTACTILGFVVAKFTTNEITEAERRDRIVHGVIAYESQQDRDELTTLLLKRGKPTPEAIATYVRFIKVFILHNLIERSSLDPEALLEKVPDFGTASLGIETYRAHLTDDQYALFNRFSIALYKKGEDQTAAIAFLEEQAKAEPPVRFANEFLGHLLSRDRERRAEAIAHFQVEAKAFPRADFSRFQLLSLNLSLKNHAELRTLLKDRDYRSLVSPQFAMELGIRMRDPLLILDGVGRADLQRLNSRILPLCLFTALIWFIILAKLGGIDRLRSPCLPLYALAVIAGAVSVTLTRVFIVWQDDIMGFHLNGEFLNDLLYCISGIGLREEVAKILLFLPFVPFIAKRRTQIQILITAGCVGLGFATMENIDYFDGPHGSPSQAFPRLVSAAFLHISLTGMLGLALCRFWHWPKRCWEELVGTFVAVVLIHGGYDALLIVRELREQVGIVHIVVLALTARYYLRKVAETRASDRQVVSPLGVFVIGSALIIGASWIVAMYLFNLDTALDGVGKGALSSAILAFIYINEFRNE